MKRIIGFILVLVSFSVLGQSQKELQKTADKLFKDGQYEEAAPIYKKLINLVPTNVTYGYKYGSCIVMQNKNNKEALNYLLQAEKSGRSDKEVAFFIGKAYENQGDYDRAVDYYERFMEVAEKEELKKLKVKHALKTCKKLQD